MARKRSSMLNQNITKLMIGDDLLLGAGVDSLAGVLSQGAVARSHNVAYLVNPDDGYAADGVNFTLSRERLEQSNDYLRRANKSVHRSWPTGNDAVNDGLRRDSYLVRWCQSIYCVGLFTDDASLLKIAGELAWPCQIYVDRFLYDQEPMDMCKLYMFDLKSESWFNWRYRWHRSNTVPGPSGIYSVIGTDKLTRAAKTAVDGLWG